VALLGGLIGLGGAEFRLPLLIAVFALYPQRAIRINLLITFATLVMSAAARLEFLGAANVSTLRIEVLTMLVGGMIAAWIGAGYLRHMPKAHIMTVIAVLLAGTAGLLAAEALLSEASWSALPHDPILRAIVGIVAGIMVGAISSLLGVAGGEFITPILIFIFGADIKTAGTASVLISIPIVLTGVARHWHTGHYLIERGETPKHEGQPWCDEIMRLHRQITGKPLWAAPETVGKEKRTDGERKSVRRQACCPETGEGSIDRKDIAQWPHSCGIELGSF